MKNPGKFNSSHVQDSLKSCLFFFFKFKITPGCIAYFFEQSCSAAQVQAMISWGVDLTRVLLKVFKRQTKRGLGDVRIHAQELL